MRLRRRPGDRAVDLPRLDAFGEEGEGRRRNVPRLRLQRGPVDGVTVEPGRRSGLEAPKAEARALQGRRQTQ